MHKTPSPSFAPWLVAFLACLSAGPVRAQFVQTGAGPWDFSDSANWTAGVINGTFSQTPAAAQTVTVAANTVLSSPLTFDLGGASPALTLRGSGGNFSLTLGGGVSVDGANAAAVTLGSNTEGQKLNLNLGGADRTFSVATGNSLTVLNGVSGGNALTKTGGGNLTLSGGSTFTGGLTINGGILAASTSNGLVATTSIVVNGTTAGTTTRFNLSTGITQTIGTLTFGGAGATSTSVNTVGIGTGATLTLGGTVTYDAANNPLGASITCTTLALGSTRTFNIGDS